MIVEVNEETIADCEQTSWRNRSALIVRFFVAGLLSLTALLKAWSPTNAAVLESVYELPKWLLMVVVQVELLLATALISGVFPKPTWKITQALFVAFAMFSLYRALSGAESCGCFGAWKISPWWSFGLDLSVLTAMAIIESRSKQREHTSNQLTLACMCYLPIGIASLSAMLPLSPESADQPAMIAANGGLTILEPEEWVGREFPLSPHLSPRVDTSEGNWIVVLYHHDCPKCREAIPQYEELAGGQRGLDQRIRVLLVEVPPYGTESLEQQQVATRTKLSDEREWFVQAPVEIELSDGLVEAASLNLPSLPSTSAPQ